MAIARKLLIPMLLAFAVLLLVSLGYFALTTWRQLNLEQEQTLQGLRQSFQDEIARQEEISLALARQTANNPSVEQAFGYKDYEQLLALTRPIWLSLRSQYRINEFQFIGTNAGVSLDVVNPENSGEQHVHEGHAHITVSSQGEEARGLVLEKDGLCVHGLTPVEGHSPSGAPVNGNVEIGLQWNESIFSDLRARYGGEWQFYLYVPSAMEVGMENLMSYETQAGVTAPAELSLQASTLQEPIFASAEHYRQVLGGQTFVENVRTSGGQFAVLSLPVEDFSGQVIGVIDILWDRSSLVQQLTRSFINAGVIALAGLLLLWFILGQFIRRTLAPVQSVSIAADAIARGNLRHPLPVMHENKPRLDEIEQLSRSFSRMAVQLRQTIGALEKLVAERTQGMEQRNQQLQAAAEIASLAAQAPSTDSLLSEAAALIQKRFGYDHVGVYLLDPNGEVAYLRAMAGERLRQPGIETAQTLRSLPITRGAAIQSLICAAASTGQPVFSVDVTRDPFFLSDPLLPDTRSQAAFPLMAAGKVIGVLDLHSREPGIFAVSSSESRSQTSAQEQALQVIAEQLAVAINSARIADSLEKTLEELSEARGKQTAENWLAFVRGRPTAAGYRYAPGDAPISGGTAGEVQAVERVDLPAISAAASEENAEELAIPIRLRGQTIGVIRLRFDSPVARWQVGPIAEEVSARLALLLESARLLEEAQNRAQREQQINVIATQMRSAVDLEGVLQNTVRELGKALGARRTYIQLGDFAVSGADKRQHPDRLDLEAEA